MAQPQQAKTNPHAASTAAEIEAEITRRARPMLEPEERAKEGAQATLRGVRMAAARCREAAAAQIARAEEWEAQAAALAKQAGE